MILSFSAACLYIRSSFDRQCCHLLLSDKFIEDNMSILLEETHPIKNEKRRFDHEDHNNNSHHSTHIPQEQCFVFLNGSFHIRPSVHYDIGSIANYECQSLRSISQTEQPSIDNILRRRYIAHWGLPGK